MSTGLTLVACRLLSCSGPNDYVFVNFVDHGAPGFVAFPSGTVCQFVRLKTVYINYIIR